MAESLSACETIITVNGHLVLLDWSEMLLTLTVKCAIRVLLQIISTILYIPVLIKF